MKIKHYISLDMGRGPMSLVEIGGGEDLVMIRVSHQARYDRSAKVDPAQARAMIERLPNLRHASGTVPPEHAASLEEEVLRWMTSNMEGVTVPQALRWLDDGNALAFRTEAEAKAYDDQHGVADERPRPAKPRRVMMG